MEENTADDRDLPEQDFEYEIIAVLPAEVYRDDQGILRFRIIPLGHG